MISLRRVFLIGYILIFFCGCHKHASYKLTFTKEYKIPTNGSIFDITAGPAGRIWYCDLTNSVIGKLDGEKIIDSKGKGPGELMFPLRIEFENGILHILEANIGRLSLFDQTGKFIDNYSLPHNPFDMVFFNNNMFLTYRSGLWEKENYIDCYELGTSAELEGEYLKPEKIPGKDEALVFRAVIEKMDDKLIVGITNPEMKILIYNIEDDRPVLEKKITRKNSYHYKKPFNNVKERRLEYISAISDIAVDETNGLIFLAESGGYWEYLRDLGWEPRIAVCDENGKFLGTYQDEKMLANPEKFGGMRLACDENSNSLFVLFVGKDVKILQYEY